MARKFVSPAVFTSEVDKSTLAQGVSAIGAAVVGRTLKGPAFAPTTVTDFNEFKAAFGDVDTGMMLPYAAKNYLKNSNILKVVRVLGTRNGNSAATNGSTVSVKAIVASGSDMLAEVHVLSGTTMSWTGSGASVTFSFSGTAGVFAGSVFSGTVSFSTGATDYIGRVFNTDATKASQYGHYLYKLFEWGGTGSGAPYTTASLSGAQATSSFDYDYQNAQSPWVISQPFGGAITYNLFRLVDRAGGANQQFKVAIANIKASSSPTVTPYGTFDIVIRSIGDTDARPEIIESFSGLSLDPSSSNYLPRVIGDQYTQWDSTKGKNVVLGKYKNQSTYIRVLMGTGNPPKDALPWGHTGYPENVTSAGSSSLVDVPMVTDDLDSQGNVLTSQLWGIDFSQKGITDRLKAGLASTSYPYAAAPQQAGAVFTLTHLSGATSSGTAYTTYSLGYSSNVPSTASSNGFVMALYGGWDGWDMTMTDPLSQTGATYVGTIALKLGIDVLSNPDEVDMNLLALPGVTDSAVTSYARQVCNERADCMAIIDISGSSVSNVISVLNTQGVDDNYAATYYPYLRYADTTNNVQVDVPPSVAMLGAYAYNDRVGQVFFAPAGLNRGGLSQFGIVDTLDHLTFEDRNDLYEARINPIATFPNEGIVAFGQKTLQVKPSALDRINVRRLLIYAKKTIASAAKLLLFEPNNPQTWQRFLNTVNPILEKVRQDQGLERFKVVMDSTVNTPDLIDRNIMAGKIFLQPTRAAEFIDLSFIISASGVEFEE